MDQVVNVMTGSHIGGGSVLSDAETWAGAALARAQSQ